MQHIFNLAHLAPYKWYGGGVKRLALLAAYMSAIQSIAIHRELHGIAAGH
jgi:hypothetical protein